MFALKGVNPKRLRLFDPRWHTSKEDRQRKTRRFRFVVISDMFDSDDFDAVEQAAADDIWYSLTQWGTPDGFAEARAKFSKYL